MAALTTTELAAASECIDRCVPDGAKLSVIIYLLATIANVSADPTTLVANASCIDRCIPQGMKSAVIINLLNTIQASGGGVSCGVGAPTVAPSGSCGWYVDTSNTATYYWDGAAWQLKA
jgi:hypothetical protein